MALIKNLHKAALIALMDEQKNKTTKIIDDASVALSNSQEAEKAFAKSHTNFEAEKVKLNSAISNAETQTNNVLVSIKAKLPQADAEIEKIKLNTNTSAQKYIENELKIKGTAALKNLTTSEKTAKEVQSRIQAIETDLTTTKANSDKLSGELKAISSEVAKQKTNIFSASSELIGDENGNHENKPALKKRIVGLEAKLLSSQEKADSLNEQAESVLEKVTDSGLHGSYESSAKRYRNASYIILSVQVIILIVMAGLAYRAINITELEQVLKNILPTIPLGVLVYFLQRTYTVEKKLAEEYQHKSTLTKTLAGYRSLYRLKHSDPEYMALFNHVKDGITRNPSEEINPLLHKRLLADKVLDTVDRAVETVTETVSSGMRTTENAMGVVKNVAEELPKR